MDTTPGSGGLTGSWILSGHGAIGSQNLASIRVPDGVEIYFFAPLGTCISNKNAWPLYYKLVSGNAQEEQAVQGDAVKEGTKGSPYRTGDSIPNLVLYGTNDFRNLQGTPAPCGVIRVGQTAPHLQLKNGEQINLYDLLYTKKYRGKLYWLACSQ